MDGQMLLILRLMTFNVCLILFILIKEFNWIEKVFCVILDGIHIELTNDKDNICHFI